MEEEHSSEAMVHAALGKATAPPSPQTQDLLIKSRGRCERISEEQITNEGGSSPSPMSTEPIARQLKHRLARMKDQNKHKQVNTTPEVLSRYHTLYLHGRVPLSVKVRAAMRSGFLRHALASLEFIAAVVSIITYLRSTYSQKPQHWAITVRKAVALFFIADYILKFYSAPVRFYYIISVSGLIDLLSTLSILSMWHRFRNDGAIPQMLLVFRALRVLPELTSLGVIGGTINQQIFLLTIYTLGAVFIAAGVLQWVEFKATSTAKKLEEGCGPEGCFTFYDAFYFIIVTITTVGYGDITPKSNLGRLITISVMLLAALILPAQINKILQLASRRPYGGRLALQKAAGSRFVIVSGNVSLKTVRRFLSGFYHPNHSRDMAAFPIRTIVMAPFKPSYDMKTLMNFYRGLVEFIEGTPTKEIDLERVSASFATAVFLLLDETTQDFEDEDTAQITRALAVHRHCGAKVRVITELRNPESFSNAIWDETEGGIEMICPELVRFQLLSRSCYVQGFSTLVINLFRSSSMLRHPNPRHWMKEYFAGLPQSIFPVILPRCFHEGRFKFEEAAELVYLSYGGILIGLDLLLPNNTRAVRLYPSGRFISVDDIGLVIATDLEAAKRISKHKINAKPIEQVKHQDMEMGVRNSDIGSRKKKNSYENMRYEPGHERSFSQDEADKIVNLSSSSSLKEAIEAATRWPPLRKEFKPERALLERRADEILENLQQNTLDVVALPRPHLLLCIEGEWPRNLFYFINSLRSSSTSHPVVILHPSSPGAIEWGSVALFPEIFFVRGSGMCELDLVRAGVLQAMKVVILTQGLNSGDSDTTSLDVKSVVIAAAVERLVAPAKNRVLVELQQEHQLQFLRPHFRIDDIKFDRRDFQRDPDARLHFAPAFASGKGLSPGAFTFLHYATFFNSSTGEIIQQLCSSGRRVEDDEEGEGDSVRRLEQIPVPEKYIGSSFCEAFQGLLHTEKALALGIYRCGSSSGGFVSTNPAPATPLACGDWIYILK